MTCYSDFTLKSCANSPSNSSRLGADRSVFATNWIVVALTFKMKLRIWQLLTTFLAASYDHCFNLESNYECWHAITSFYFFNSYFCHIQYTFINCHKLTLENYHISRKCTFPLGERETGLNHRCDVIIIYCLDNSQLPAIYSGFDAHSENRFSLPTNAFGKLIPTLRGFGRD